MDIKKNVFWFFSILLMLSPLYACDYSIDDNTGSDDISYEEQINENNIYSRNLIEYATPPKILIPPFKILIPPFIEPKIIRPWTIIVYCALDNDITYDSEHLEIVRVQLSQLEAIASRDYKKDVNIVVLIDAYKINSKITDGYYYLTGGKFKDDIMRSTGEINTGDSSTAIKFIDWAVDNFPAERYFFSIYNHGGNFVTKEENTIVPYNIGVDESHGRDRLTHTEVGEITSHFKNKIGKKIDLFYPFACMMGGIEFAYEVADDVEYMVSSEQIIENISDAFIPLINIIGSPNIPTVDLGKQFCDIRYNYAEKKSETEDNYMVTASLVDLKKLKTLYSQMNGFSYSLINAINQNSKNAEIFNAIAEKTTHVLAPVHIFLLPTYYIDLGDFLTKFMNSPNIDGVLRSHASIVNNTYNEAVVYKRNFGDVDMTHTGLTILNNTWIINTNYTYDMEFYRKICKFGKNKWTDYQILMAKYRTK